MRIDHLPDKLKATPGIPKMMSAAKHNNKRSSQQAIHKNRHAARSYNGVACSARASMSRRRPAGGRFDTTADPTEPNSSANGTATNSNGAAPPAAAAAATQDGPATTTGKTGSASGITELPADIEGEGSTFDGAAEIEQGLSTSFNNGAAMIPALDTRGDVSAVKAMAAKISAARRLARQLADERESAAASQDDADSELCAPSCLPATLRSLSLVLCSAVDGTRARVRK